MTFAATTPDRSIATDPATLIGIANLAKMAFDGIDLDPLRRRLIARIFQDHGDSAALMDLSAVTQLHGRRDDGLRLQTLALERSCLYRRRPAGGAADGIRLLAFMAPGDFMANAPLEFLLDGSDVTLDLFFVVPGSPPPAVVPEHDLAIVAVGESDANQEVLRDVARLVGSWPRPVLNAPDRIGHLSRDAAHALLG